MSLALALTVTKAPLDELVAGMKSFQLMMKTKSVGATVMESLHDLNTALKEIARSAL
jgi:hypothetical protein